MDPLTHSLASLALQRGLFPKASWRAALTILFAGLIADVDFLSANFGPSGYLRWNRTTTHSLAFVALLAITTFLFTHTLRDPQRSIRWMGLSWTAVAAAALIGPDTDDRPRRFDPDVDGAVSMEVEIRGLGVGEFFWGAYDTRPAADMGQRLPFGVPWPAPPERDDFHLQDARYWTDYEPVLPGEATAIGWPPPGFVQ